MRIHRTINRRNAAGQVVPTRRTICGLDVFDKDCPALQTVMTTDETTCEDCLRRLGRALEVGGYELIRRHNRAGVR